jgi:hypothetical protein
VTVDQHHLEQDSYLQASTSEAYHHHHLSWQHGMPQWEHSPWKDHPHKGEDLVQVQANAYDPHQCLQQAETLAEEQGCHPE